MRILGIDPGSVTTGFGVIERTQGQTMMTYIASGCIRTNQRGSLSLRLQQIYDHLSDVIELYRPQIASIERVFVHKNALSALKLGHARGVAMLAVAKYGLPIDEYTPRTIKQAVVGYGGADKIQVQDMVCRLLKLSDKPAFDAADALAIALCHAHRFNLAGRSIV